MKRNISSSFTFFHKYIFPSVWTGGFGYATLRLILSEDEECILFLMLWIIGSFLWVFCIRLKKVVIDDKYLYISNYFKTIKVPLSEIESVVENVFISTHPIWICFKNKTGFGYKIMFMPNFHWRCMFFCSHPVVKELCRLTENNSSDGSKSEQSLELCDSSKVLPMEESKIKEIAAAWQSEIDSYVLKAATENINEYPPEVRIIIRDEALKRGLLKEG